MSETTLDILAQRLDRLERETRYQRLLVATILVGLFAASLIGPARGSSQIVEAERVVLKDQAGKIRACPGQELHSAYRDARVGYLQAAKLEPLAGSYTRAHWADAAHGFLAAQGFFAAQGFAAAMTSLMA